MQQGKLIGLIVKMKGVIALQLLLLFVIHNMGYFLVFNTIKQTRKSDFTEKVAQKNYSPDQLETAAIPISFPYNSDQKEFTDVNETLELNGTYFHIVKKRYENDTLYIVYLNDRTANKVHQEFENWKEKAGNSQDENTTRESIFSMLDYQYLVTKFTYTPISYSQIQLEHSKYIPHVVDNIYLDVLSPPPKHIG